MVMPSFFTSEFNVDLRNLIIQFLWDERYSNRKGEIEITFIHRGTPSGLKSIFVSEINKLDGNFMIVEENHIPLHRVVQIMDVTNDAVLYYNNKIPNDN
jgi:uncharacterized protein (UPF0248 family)